MRHRLFPLLDQFEARQFLSTSVLSYRGDNSASGVNSFETTLTYANVNAAHFGKIASAPLDGQVYAQPLVAAGVKITVGNKGVRDVVYVATEHDSVYALDATTGAVLWKKSFVNVTGGVTMVPSAEIHNFGLISPEIGITSTPVIDPGSKTLYVVAYTKEVRNGNAHYVLRLHALDLGSGADKNSVLVADTLSNNSATASPTYIYVRGPRVNGTGAGSVGGSVFLNATLALQRSALSLVNGVVYFAMSSDADFGTYHGWILGYSASTLALKAAWVDTPNGSQGGIWMAGGKITSDSHGNLYVVIGNGTFDTTLDSQGFPVMHDFGESVVKLAADSGSSATKQNGNGWGLKVADYFTPHDQQALNAVDLDIGSTDALLFNAEGGGGRSLLFFGGKAGTYYLLDQNRLGKFSPTTDRVVQEIHGEVGLFANPAVFGGSIYTFGMETDGRRRAVSTGLLSGILNRTAIDFGYPGAAPTISANGTANAIVWALDDGMNILHAYRAGNLTELWNSGTALDSSVKFTPVTEANGKVYAGTADRLVIFGELSGVGRS